MNCHVAEQGDTPVLPPWTPFKPAASGALPASAERMRLGEGTARMALLGAAELERYRLLAEQYLPR